MAFATSRIARVGAAIVLSLGMTAGLASTVLATAGVTDPTNSTVTANPLTVPADGVTASTITVTLKDSGDAPVTNLDTVSLAKTGGTAVTANVSISPPVAANVSGVATFSVSSTTAGTAIFTATDTTAVVPITKTATVTFGATAGNSTVVASLTSVPADNATTSMITVTLKDSTGGAVSGKTVTLAQTSGPGSATISAASGPSDGSGHVTFTVKSGTAGPYVFKATDTTDSVIITQTASVSFYGAVAKLLVLLPGETAAPGSPLGYTGTPATEYVGVPFYITVEAVDANWDIVPTVTSSVSIDSLTDGLFTSTLAQNFTNGVATFVGTFNTVGTETVTATDGLLTGTSAGAVVSAPLGSLVVTAPSSVAAGSPFSITVTAYGTNSVQLSGYRGTIHFTSTDSAVGVVLPANYTFTSGDAGTHTFISGFTLETAGSQTVTATDLSSSIHDVSGVITVTTASTYYPLATPARVVDTRINLGITGKLTANVPASFQVWGDGVVPSGATAVTGNVTVVNETNAWALYLGPVYTATPSTSNINFTAGQIIGNGGTVPLTATGGLYATYMSTAGNTTDLVFDITGYYMPNTLGATYHPLSTPWRVLDTRNDTGLSSPLSANTPVSFQVTNVGSPAIVPSNATAVTGNVTVVNDTSAWAVYLGPVYSQYPTTSTINFTAGQINGNGLTVALNSLGTLYATYMSNPGNTTDLVFDVTGYYTPDTTGSEYVPITPTRVLDTRNDTGLAGPLYANTPATLLVTGSVVPSVANAVTGNVTVVNETAGWAVFLGPAYSATPATSTINFVVGQTKGNGLTVGLASGGYLYPTYMSTAGNTTDLVFDVTGYFVP
jgi:hypothetical protein